MSRVAVVCLVLLLTGCGASGNTAHRGSPTPSASTSSAASSSATASPPSDDPPGPWRGAIANNEFVRIVRPFQDAKNTVTAATNAFGGDHLPTKKEFPAVWAPVIADCAAAQDAAHTTIARLTDAQQKNYWPTNALPAIGRSIREIRWYANLMTQCPQMHSTGDVVQWYMTTDRRREDTLEQKLQKAVTALLAS